MFAMLVPPLAVLACGVIELTLVTADHRRMQGVADAAALAGARELAVALAGADERAKAFAEEQLDFIQAPATADVTAVVGEDGSVSVDIVGYRPSFFGDLLPPGGWKLKAHATATSMNTAPLCVLSHGESGAKTVNLLDSSAIDAGRCLIHSNQDIVAEGSSRVEAGVVQVGTSASGFINPAAQEGAPLREDPFATLSTSTNAPCTDFGLLVLLGLSRTLQPGVHCGNVQAHRNTRLTLAPGAHYFRNAHLMVKENGLLYGRDVVLFLDKNSKLKFQDEASVDLEGRKSGAHAGFLLVTDRDNTNDLEILSDNVDNLLGVVYVPSAKLVVMGHSPIAEQSDWTVVVAKSIQLKGSGTLKINSNYAGSPVPVPRGVGPVGSSRLAR